MKAYKKLQVMDHITYTLVNVIEVRDDGVALVIVNNSPFAISTELKHLVLLEELPFIYTGKVVSEFNIK